MSAAWAGSVEAAARNAAAQSFERRDMECSPEITDLTRQTLN
jgi:hypothetical protein